MPAPHQDFPFLSAVIREVDHKTVLVEFADGQTLKLARTLLPPEDQITRGAELSLLVCPAKEPLKAHPDFMRFLLSELLRDT